MKVLVTGATGFVGTWLVEALLEKGFDVSALYRKTSNLDHFKNLNIRWVLGDLEDPESLQKALEHQRAVFHLGGFIGYGNPERMEKINVQGTDHLLKASEDSGSVERFVHFSSVAAVGAGLKPSEILNEDSPYNVQRFHLGYFDTKKKAEDLVKASRLNAVILNPSTIYGPRDSQKPSRKTQLKVAQGKFPFYPPGGASVIHIKDVISATLTAFEKGANKERYILSGDNLTLKALFHTISELAGVSPPSIYLPGWVLKALGLLGDYGLSPVNSETATISTLYHWFDSSKAQRELGLQITPSKKALQDSISWSQKQGLI